MSIDPAAASTSVTLCNHVIGVCSGAIHDHHDGHRAAINISGATMSVRSMSAGVKRVLVLVDVFYLKPAGMGSDTVASRKTDKGIFTSIFGN